MLNFIKNATIYRNKYKIHDRAMIIACYFNPERNPYRLKAFNIFYKSIAHLPHRIIECTIDNSVPELKGRFIEHTNANTLLWHKETLLNQLITKLPKKYEYVFWLDTDVIFTNLNWLVEGVEQLQHKNIIQPFEYCFHLERDRIEPDFRIDLITKQLYPHNLNPSCWRSFCSNIENKLYQNDNYDSHGHVGFAWGARREVLDRVPLYDKALIGGADHIIAHAAAGQIDFPCISKAFKSQDLAEIRTWSTNFSRAVKGKVGYVKGNLFHIWHGDLKNREYLQRIQEFGAVSNRITRRDRNGFWENEADNNYMADYYRRRESVELSDDWDIEVIENNEAEVCTPDPTSSTDTCTFENYS